MNTKFNDVNRSTQFDIDGYYKLYYKNYDQIKKAVLTEKKSPFNNISIIEPLFKEAIMMFESNLKSSFEIMNAIINLIEKGSTIELE
jgi:hypothetical protein